MGMLARETGDNLHERRHRVRNGTEASLGAGTMVVELNNDGCLSRR